MTKFSYTSHFKFRAKQRGISFKLTRDVYERASEKYYDILRRHHIAVTKLQFRKKMRTFMVAYDIIGDTVEFITVHIIKEREILNKVTSGRWKHEKD